MYESPEEQKNAFCSIRKPAMPQTDTRESNKIKAPEKKGVGGEAKLRKYRYKHRENTFLDSWDKV